MLQMLVGKERRSKLGLFMTMGKSVTQVRPKSGKISPEPEPDLKNERISQQTELKRKSGASLLKHSHVSRKNIMLQDVMTNQCIWSK